MTFQSWFIYLALVVVATATPGPAVLFVVTNSALHGWRKATYAAFGNITGLFCLGIIAISGLGAILKTSELIFNIVKYAGSLYLMFLGLKLIFQKSEATTIDNTEFHPANAKSVKIFIRAFSVAVSNPKAIVFLTALFPQFINHNKALVPQFLLLIAVLMAFSFGFLVFYALIADIAKNWLNSPDKNKTLSRTSGSIFLGFGILMATSSNR